MQRKAFALLAGLWCALVAAQDDGFHPAYYRVDSLNKGLAAPSEPINLSTPQAALEHFILSCRDEDYGRAAHALNLNLIPQATRLIRAPFLAEKFFYVINQRLWLDWDEVPDRPDGQTDAASGSDPLAGEPRRSIRIGRIDADGRDIAIRLQRVKAEGQEPVWVFSANTVENIDLLYDRFGPGLLEQHLPGWAKVRTFGKVPLWSWFALAVAVMLSAVFGWAFQKFAIQTLRQRLDRDWPGVTELLGVLSTPLGLLGGLICFYFVTLSLITLTGPVGKVLYPTLALLIVLAFTWLGMRSIGFFSDYVSRQYSDELQSYERADVRRKLTLIAVSRRVLIFIALALGVGVALSELNLLDSLGISLLASAGIASVILGVAAQSVLGNILAGIQIALTRPAKIGDNIYFENQWGYVEEITYTYIVIQTWDQRRVVVPLKYFLERPFENWSMKDPHMLRPFYLYADYRIDVRKVRDKFAELLKNDEDWDEQNEPTLQVTALNDETLELRALCSAKDPSAAWDLHCRMREALIDYVQNLDDGRYLPRRRVRLEDGRGAAKATA